MTRRDYDAERRAREAGGALVFSNSCGQASSSFRVIRADRVLPASVEATSTIGEWCDPPLALSQDFWLVIMDADTREMLASYAVVEQGGAAYALVVDSEEELRGRSSHVRERLALQDLPEPIEYSPGHDMPEASVIRWAEARPAFAIRDGKVWLVRAVPLDSVFPGLSLN